MAEQGAVRFLPGAAGERALVARLCAGEEPAYRELYDAHAPRLRRLVGRMVGEPALADELVQETFIAAFRNLRGYRFEAALSTWLTRIAVHHALNAQRSRARRLAHARAEAFEASSHEPDPARQDLARRVMALVDRLDPPKRLAMLLVAEGHTAAEIAAITDEPRGTILSRLSRARAEVLEQAIAAGLTEAAALAGSTGEGA